MTLSADLSEFRNALLFLLLAVLWGSSYVAIDVGLAELPPLLFGAVRYDVAGLLLVGLAVWRGLRLVPRTRGEWTSVVVGATLLIAVHIGSAFVGQRYVTGAIAAIVLSTVPVLTPVFAWAVVGKRIGHRTVVGAVLGLVGVGVIAAPSPGALGDSATGVAILLVSAASFALGAVLLERLPDTLPTESSQAWMMLGGAGLLHLTSPVAGEAPLAYGPASLSTTAILAVLYLAVVAGTGGYLVYFDLLRRIGSVKVSLVNYAVPVVAAVTGWLLLGDGLALRELLGFGLVAVGFTTAQWGDVVRIQARLSRGYSAKNEYVTDASAMGTAGVPTDD